MATTSATVPAAPPDAVEPPRKGGRRLAFVLAPVLLAGAGGGAWFYFQHEKPPVEDAHAGGAPAKADPIFVPLESAFVVNLEDDEAMRFMQAEVQVVVHDAKTVDLVKLHMPLIRNRLMLLFSGQHYRDLNTRAAKEKLQAQALEEVRKVMQEQTGAPQVDALYFTSLVMQ